MPTLPSGRRIEFSLDRFHALLERVERSRVREIAANLNDPDDLLFVMDAVHFSLEDGAPYFADYVATDWATRAADWNMADRQVLQAWFASSEARSARAEAIDYIKGLYLDRAGSFVAYPYLVQGGMRQAGMVAGPTLRQ
jgi:ABC-type dipeptide/oligopeptide/nickel transport system ATPase component